MSLSLAKCREMHKAYDEQSHPNHLAIRQEQQKAGEMITAVIAKTGFFPNKTLNQSTTALIIIALEDKLSDLISNHLLLQSKLVKKSLTLRGIHVVHQVIGPTLMAYYPLSLHFLKNGYYIEEVGYHEWLVQAIVAILEYYKWGVRITRAEKNEDKDIQPILVSEFLLYIPRS
jgi:hypothetical protein